jgi:hypothetical protein
MQRISSWRHKARSVITALLILPCTAAAYGADTYNPSNHQLTIPTLAIGNGTYSNVVITVGSVVKPPTGTSPNGNEDTYNPSNNQLTVQSVLDGNNTYYNVIVTVAALDSIGSVTGVDTYNGGRLSMPTVQVLGGSVYSNVIITAGSILSAGGRMPMNVRDVYDPQSKRLTIAAVQLGNKVYTNAIVTVGSIVSVGGNDSALKGSYGTVGYFFTDGITQPPTPPVGSPQAEPLGFSSDNGTFTFDGAGNWTATATTNTDGAGSVGSFSGTYSMISANMFAFTTSGSTDVQSGYLLAGGSMFNFSKNPGEIPSIGVGVKTGASGFSNASLNGSYGLVMYYHGGGVKQPPTPPAGSPQAGPLGFGSVIGAINFDGAGHYTSNGTSNIDGAGSPGSVSGTYSVNSAGSFTLTSIGSSDIFSGFILAGGSMINLSKNPGNVPAIGIGVKVGGSGYSNSSLNGRYGLVTYFHTGGVTQPPTPPTGSPQAKPLGFSSTNGTITFDGAGHYTASGTTNTDSAGSAGGVSGNYSVNSAGLFTLTVSGSADTSSGYVLAGGSVFNFSNNPGDVPSIGFGIAQ